MKTKNVVQSTVTEPRWTKCKRKNTIRSNRSRRTLRISKNTSPTTRILLSKNLVNYAERHRYDEIISMGFVESTVNYVIAKRFSKKQSMQWPRKGAHLLLQVRTKVLNNERGVVFQKRYPNFRPIKSVKELDII